MTAPASPGIPEGFEKVPPRGPFIDVNGPIWRKPGKPGELPAFGFLAERRHTNGLGFVHGGMIATFLDNAMAQAIHETFNCRLVTLRLHVTYLNVVMRGRWCTASVDVGASNENRLDAAVTLVSSGQTCATATGHFQLFP